uniref:helix-turn-helix domain-containing protein n=1 Tax=Ruminococcus bromii TaxID=40518 RepID=UPI004027D7BF
MKYNSINNAKRYFTLPNEIFCIGLSSGEIAVYSYLLRCENRKTYQCCPSYKTIGQALKMSKNTVRKYIQSLEEKHLIETEKTEVYTKTGQKRNGTLLYTIRPIAEAIDCFHNEQLRRNA